MHMIMFNLNFEKCFDSCLSGFNLFKVDMFQWTGQIGAGMISVVNWLMENKNIERKPFKFQ